MTSEPLDDGEDAEVIELRAADAGTEAHLAEAAGPAYVTLGDGEPQRRAIIPAHWRTREAAKRHLQLMAARHGHAAAYHGVRVPRYAVLTAVWSVAGVFRTSGRLIRWWHIPGSSDLEHAAAANGLIHEHLRLHAAGKKTRTARGLIIAVCAAIALIALGGLAWYGRWWAWALLLAVLVPCLARAGRPSGRPIVQAAVIPAAVQAPTQDVITRALGSLGIAGIDRWLKDDRALVFPSPVREDGPGWRAEVDLPFGVTATAVIERREQLASGLRRPLGAVWPEPVTHEHAGRLELWVGRTDLSKAKQAPWPLLRGGQADVFAGFPFGTDPRGRTVKAPMAYHNWLAGSIPRQGKTGTVRVLTCAAALDPVAEQWIHELKGSGDLDPLEKVCHRFCSGVDDESIAYAAESLRLLRAEIGRRTERLKALPREVCPDKRVTREIARRRSLKLWPIVCTIDECFPAGTLVGELPIDRVRVGDVVPSWDEQTGVPCDGVVTRVFRKRPSALVRLWMDDGTTLVCTPEHPLMTDRGWRQAGRTANAFVLSFMHAAQKKFRDAAASGLLSLRSAVPDDERRPRPGGPEDRPGVLLAGMHAPGAGGERDESRPGEVGTGTALVVAAHDRAQPDGRPGRPGEGLSLAGGEVAQAAGPGWQRARYRRAPAVAGELSRLARGSHRADRCADQGRAAYSLQAGHCPPRSESGSGSRREFPLQPGRPGPGPAQGRVARWRRVDRVEVLEPGRDGRYGGLCPDGHVYNLEVAGTHVYRVAGGIVAHNCQNLFAHPQHGKAAGADAEFIIKIGPAFGVILILATQRPDRASLPTGISGNVSDRFCLKVTGQVENDMILGTSAYKNGIRATSLRPEIDAGIGYYVGGAQPQVVRVFYLDLPATERIAARARALREQAGTLTGVAAGMDEDEAARDVLADLAAVFGGDHKLHWTEAAARLAQRFPDRWAGAEAEAVSAEARAHGVPSVNVRMGGEQAKGCRRPDVDKAADGS